MVADLGGNYWTTGGSRPAGLEEGYMLLDYAMEALGIPEETVTFWYFPSARCAVNSCSQFIRVVAFQLPTI
ncbi:hypothetical protein BDZ91DRAFT_409547 [Kalaharituber pfeilii]|nr:hypothetical protein BDZ91DRAFT_409547 [Kalaharituber pfeilii]